MIFVSELSNNMQVLPFDSLTIINLFNIQALLYLPERLAIRLNKLTFAPQKSVIAICQ